MTVTRIGEKNAAAFAPLLAETAALPGRDILRLGAIDGGAACAAAAFRVSERTAELLSLYVAPDYRRRGAARTLLETFASLADGTPLTSLTACFPRDDKNGLEAFFTAEDFAVFGGSPRYSLRLDAARGAESFRRNTAGVRGRVLSCDKLTSSEWRALAALVKNYGAAPDELFGGGYSPALSFVCFERETPVAGLFCADFGERISIDFLFSAAASAAPTMAILARLAEALAARDPATELEFLAANPAVLPIAQKLFGPLLHTCSETAFAVRLLTPQQAAESP